MSNTNCRAAAQSDRNANSYIFAGPRPADQPTFAESFDDPKSQHIGATERISLLRRLCRNNLSHLRTNNMLKEIVAGLVGAILFSGVAAAQTCASYPYTFSNGTTADANQVNSNFSTIMNCANNNLAPIANPSFTGNVGIGTASPASLLNLQSPTWPTLTITKTGIGSWQVGASDTSNDFQIWLNSIAPDLSIASGGNIGIGNTSPQELLTVGTGIVGSNVSLGGTTGYANIGSDFSAWSTIIGSNVRARDSASAPGMELATSYTGAGASAIRLDFGSIEFDTASASDISGYTQGTAFSFPKMTITSAGNVGIGTTSPSYTLHVNGSVAGTSAYINLSDERLKKDVVPIQDALEIVEKLRGVRFEWRKPSERVVGKTLNLPVGRPQIGFIAQEVKQVLPEAVTVSHGKNAIMSMEESKIIPVLVEAMKTLITDNKSQAVQIKNLQRQVSALERKKGARTAANDNADIHAGNGVRQR